MRINDVLPFFPCMTEGVTMSNPDETRRLRRALLKLLAGASLGGTAAGRAAAQSAEPVQGVRALEGDVRINGRPASPGTPVRPGDSVATGGGANAMIVVGRNAYLARENSRIEIPGRNYFVDSLRLLTGKLLCVFASGEPRRIVTPSATIGIRGTGAYLEAEAERTYFCLCYGSAEVESMNGMARDSYSTTHHESPRYLYNNRQERVMEAAGVINHTDAELIMLEALVGRTPPDAFMSSPVRY
jgi:hypothetical protein